jgi:hypothetical protein
MLRTRNYDRWFAKQMARRQAMIGWDSHSGEYHSPRRNNKYGSKGWQYVRKSHGRHPNQNFLK